MTRCVAAIILLCLTICHALQLDESQVQPQELSTTKRACVLNDDNTISCIPTVSTSTASTSNLSVASHLTKKQKKIRRKRRVRRRMRKQRRRERRRERRKSGKGSKGKSTKPPSTKRPTSKPPSGARSGRCAEKDVICWSKKALALTNAVRKKEGVSQMLKHGTQAQMNNAMKHARYLARIGYLKHQVLQTATKEVKCERFVSGENLAYHYEKDNVAGMCVDLWISSRGHFLNLVRDWFKEMVMGVYFAGDGRVYCVQTFALIYPSSAYGSKDGPQCHEARSVRI